MEMNESLSHLDLFTPIRIYWIQRCVDPEPVWTITNKAMVIHFVGKPENYQVIHMQQHLHLIVIYFYRFVFYFKNYTIGISLQI